MSKQKQKEPLSIMIAKTVLVVAVITGLGTIIIGGGVVIMKYYNGEVNDRIVKTVDQEKEIYYDVLEKKCAGSSCCLSSLKFMKENNYKEAGKDYKCPDGFKAGGLKCESSLSWCEPMKEDCKKHGEIPDYISPGDDMSVQCCSGLKHKTQKKYFDENCVNLFEKHGYGGYAGICVNCGDNICDTEFENRCNCPEDCGDENRCLLAPEGGPCKAIIVKYYFDQEEEKCKEFNWGGCGGVVPFETMEDCKKECEKEPGTSSWQTYRNEEFGFEFKYPKIGEYYGDEIKLFEKENVIKLCTKDDMGREYNFCHSLEVFRISEEEIVKNAIKKIRIKDEDQSVCFIKEYQLYDDWNFKTYKIVDQTGAASPIGPCGYYGFELFAADPKNSQIFFLLPVIQDSFLDVEKWLKSFKFIEK